ncbi:MAG: thymidine phosphorylase [Armatimonadetes bacterium]|nr:thymidine phosphorylase [Armatimonadota bacterium]
MRTQDIIAAKRDGRELADEDIARIVREYSSGDVPDYQMSAFLMATYIRGLTFAETSALTRAMVDSGATLDLSSIPGTKVDKHSSGGVGDKTTLVVVPVLAACGLKAAKMSGRGLGFTGGTLDKLESIPGFNTALSVEAFVRQVREIGAAIAGQTHDIVPADKKIYALRDVTATVDSIPLIAASVMSKKIACGSDVILLDVKCGSGAFAKDIDQARELARTMMAIGRSFGRRVSAAITDMSQPLGRAVGNALEVAEAIETIKGGGPEDFRTLCTELAGIMLYIAGQSPSVEAGRARAVLIIDSGETLDMFMRLVAAQNGDRSVIHDPSRLPRAALKKSVLSGKSGTVRSIVCWRIGAAASMLGAGRERKEDTIDPAVGIVVNKRLGESVEEGEALAVIHANDAEKIPAAESMIVSAFHIGDAAAVPPLVHEVIIEGTGGGHSSGVV